MSERNFLATHNLIAVSANNKETAINTEQALDTAMLCALGDMINLMPRREHNGDEATGYEEPDSIYDLGALTEAVFNFEKAQPQHFAFLLAYALGSVSTAAAGSGYKHTITPIDGDLDAARSVPSFTAAQRYGKTVMKRRFASCFVDAITATFSRDSWCRISGNIKGTGKKTESIIKETVAAAGNATQLTLAANAVAGTTAAARLANVHSIKVELSPGVWTNVVFTAVSDATPAVITIVDPGGEASPEVDYKILYAPEESDWMTFPARVDETPLRVAGVTLNVGGKWSGSAFAGGRSLSAEVKQIEWSFNNNLEVQFVPGGSDTYASRAIRTGRAQKITLDREFREFIMQQHIADNDTFGLYIKAEGALYDETYKYQVEIVFPKVAVIAAPLSVDNKRLAEVGDLQVLEDATYGSVVVMVQNLQDAYAA